jgi:hypothetical protein
MGLKIVPARYSTVMSTESLVNRHRLKEITHIGDIERHVELIRELNLSIEPVPSEFNLSRYTCIVYALELTEDPDYVAIASHGLGSVYAGTEFAQYLLLNHCLCEISEQAAKPGDLVFYFESDRVVHAGKVAQPGRVISKWGIGQLLEHPTLAVPEQYGDSVKYFSPIDKEEILDVFVEFAKSKGMRFCEG